MIVRYNHPASAIKVNRLMDAFINGTIADRFGSDAIDQRPRVNVLEQEDHFQIELAAPGLSKEDFQVKLEEDTLIISSSKKEEKTDEKDQYTRREYSYCSFERSFRLPENVDGEQVSAEYINGVLKVSLPKQELNQEDKVRHISVQ